MIRNLLIGDGSLERGKTGARFSMSHCLAQKDYLQAKADFLGCGNRVQEKNWAGAKTVFYVKTTMRPEWVQVYDDFYPDGQKKICLEHVLGLSELGLAIWYADDGSLQKDKRPVIWASLKVIPNPEPIQEYLTDSFGKVNLAKYPTKSGTPKIQFYFTDAAAGSFWEKTKTSLIQLRMTSKLPRRFR